MAAAFGFPGSYPITGQTSPRKPEFYLLSCLSGLAQSATKLAADALRLLAREAARQVKEEGRTNPLLQLVAADPAFRLDAESLAGLLKPERFVGRAPAQVDEFLAEHVRPWLAIHPPSLPDEEPQV